MCPPDFLIIKSVSRFCELHFIIYGVVPEEERLLNFYVKKHRKAVKRSQYQARLETNLTISPGAAVEPVAGCGLSKNTLILFGKFDIMIKEQFHSGRKFGP